jgi:hypothetical protein
VARRLLVTTAVTSLLVGMTASVASGASAATITPAVSSAAGTFVALAPARLLDVQRRGHRVEQGAVGVIYLVQVFTSNGDPAAQATTGVDGTYIATGLTASVTGYTVCFDGTSASGGTSATGYQSRCYLNVSWDASTYAPASGARLVPVTVGSTAAGKSATLPAA